MLLFKRKFLDAIRSGEKTQTVRVWKQRYLKPGQITYTPGVGKMLVTDVEEVTLESLSDDDARLDGFPSAAELVAEIKQLYAERLAGGYRIFKIRFTPAEPA